ncbi:MAG: hypothetical protein ACXABU_16275, partial [Candidatus Hodarchaeales archaeon]
SQNNTENIENEELVNFHYNSGQNGIGKGNNTTRNNESENYVIRPKISASNDIEFERISPEAMEKDASLINYILNFTITDNFGLNDPTNIFENLTISNQLVTTWFDWRNLIDDHYSLQFSLNSTFLSTLALEDHDLTLHIKVWTGASFHYSHFTIPLPMKDLQITILNYPSEFNNKDESEQNFNLTFRVTEDDGTGVNPVTSLPSIIGSNGEKINPNVTIQSSTSSEISGFLRFINFPNNGSIGSGIYTVTVAMNGSIALLFEEGFHNLILQVITDQGISENNIINDFEAKGTVFIVKISWVQVNSYNKSYLIDLTNDSTNHVDFRLNLDDNFTFYFEVWENDTGILQRDEKDHLIDFQDPNRAEDPTAVFTSPSSFNGDGILTISSNVTTPANGYTFSVYVRGHKNSQSLFSPTNITIFWDLLKYQYSYQDDLNLPGEGGDYGENYQGLALGLDVDENWTLALGVYYASDDSPALTSQVSYRFSDDMQWITLIDGDGLDLPDGKFTITRSSSLPQILTFTCRIEAGSKISWNGTKFVTQTFSSFSFTLDITWTFLIIDLDTPTDRLNLGDITSIDARAYWAHDPSNQTMFTGIINILDEANPGFLRDMVVTDGWGSLPGYFKTEGDGIGRYLFRVNSISDSTYDIAKFTNSTIYRPEDQNVRIAIIWDRIYFVFTNTYNASLTVSNQNWGVTSFFTNYNETTTLYCFGRHQYDQTPFSGAATLIDFNNGASASIIFNPTGLAIWRGDRSDARDPEGVPFRVWFIEYENNWNMSLLDRYYPKNIVRITWEKVVVTMVANKTFKSGTWADIQVYYEYEINGSEVDPQNIRYDILLINESVERENFSLISFRDFSFGPLIQTYTITYLLDSSSGLSATNVDVRYVWLDQGEESYKGFLTIEWIDTQPPVILESQIVNLGNGTILIATIVTDSSDNYLGSGVRDITLVDTRHPIAQDFPQGPEIIILSPTQTLYIFHYSYNQRINSTQFPIWEGNEDFFQFSFDDTLSFTVIITDGEGYTDSYNHESLLMDSDNIQPKFLLQDTLFINASFETMNSSSDVVGLTDGKVTISVLVQDDEWSGLSPDSVLLTISDLDGNFSVSFPMVPNLANFERYSPTIFEWRGNLSVFKSYFVTVTIEDLAGNINQKIIELDILDVVGPQIKSLSVVANDDRTINIKVEFEESGLGVDYVALELTYSGTTHLISIFEGNQGSSSVVSQRYSFSASIQTTFDLWDLIEDKDFSFVIVAADLSGNTEKYSSEDLKSVWNFTFDEKINSVTDVLIVNPFFWGIVIFLFITVMIVAIRVTSRVEGYDVKKIFEESEKIPREVILTQMDEYALGVTINFFDQVQGPVPVIWEPPLLEDQEQVMLDLSDKSFSILEFVGLDESERSGTFDFSTGSYDCTALGYSFSMDNPQARGGKENLTVVLLLRKEWGDNLLVFQDELVEKLREIRNLVETKTDPVTITRSARELREFVSRLMISLDRLYLGSSLGKETNEE